MAGEIVKNIKTGNIGVVVVDSYKVCGDNEIPVVYEGLTAFCGTNAENLKVIKPETPIADPEKCGAGLGEKCCIFLSVDPDGFKCERFTEIRNDILSRKDEMKAKRHPKKMFPDCYLDSKNIGKG